MIKESKQVGKMYKENENMHAEIRTFTLALNDSEKVVVTKLSSPT